MILSSFPLLLFSQSPDRSGIKFQQINSWNELVSQAVQTNKFIFIDMYATWCAPCKEMDRTVYSSDKVGAITAKNFVSVKLQVDQTNRDDVAVIKNRHLTDSLAHQFNVVAFPTFLFLTPDGKLIKREEGYKDADAFINVLKDAMTPNNGYQAKIERYSSGKLSYIEMPTLAWEAVKIGDNETAKKIARDYSSNFLSKLSAARMLTTDNLRVIWIVGVEDSKSPYFQLVYQNSAKVDSLLDSPVSTDIIRYVINKEEIDSVIYKKPINIHPNWQIIYKRISEEYDKKYADKLIPFAKLSFYQKENQWKAFAKAFDEQIANKPIEEKTQFLGDKNGDAWALNGWAWDTFVNCNDMTVLRKALAWIDLALGTIAASKDSVQYLDTKANILYKLGQKALAIEIEKKAIKIDSKNGSFFQKEYSDELEKMKKGEATWPVSN